MNDYLNNFRKQNAQIQNAMHSLQEENARRAQHQHDAERANISTAKTLQEMVDFMQQEKQDRIKSDRLSKFFNIVLICIGIATLIATIKLS